MSEVTLKRTITAGPAILLVVSGIIGSGVFKKIAPMADNLHSPLWILGCWIVAGLISLAGALCVAELGGMMPASGGSYIYFRRIYGKIFAFLFGWCNLVIIKSASIAALAFVFSQSFNVLFPIPDSLGGGTRGIKILASLLVILLSGVNYRGIIFSERLSRVFTLAIIVVIVVFIIAGVWSRTGALSHFEASGAVPGGWQMFSAIFAASLNAFWAYEGWSSLGLIGDEIVNPRKNIPLAIVAGTLIVITLYVLVNAVYLYLLPVGELVAIAHNSNAIAAVEAARAMGGNPGAIIFSALILCSTFSCTNSTILTSARIFFAMARDGVFIEHAGQVHPKYQTPSTAIVMQGVWAVVLIWSGSFDELTNLLIFAAFIYYGASSLGVIVLRRRSPDDSRPYKVPGYPVVPALFTFFCLVLVIVTLVTRPASSLTGLGLIATGVPAYWYFSKRKARNG